MPFATETFRRVVEHLPQGGVFGFVLPQTFLRSKQAARVREILLREYEIAEISLFADKVFRYGDAESAIVVGRRLGQVPQYSARYQRVREGQIPAFSRTYEPTSSETVTRDRFTRLRLFSLFLPDLSAVWDALSGVPMLGAFADVGQGFIHKSENDPAMPRGTVRESPVPIKGVDLVPGFTRWDDQQTTHGLPTVAWLNLNPETIRRPMSGRTTGLPQVLLNYAHVSREPWRLKAIIDEQGHPVTSRYNVVRPRSGRPSLRVLWAILNSPIGNAYAYCFSGKRDVLAGDMRRLPVPDFAELDLGVLEKAVADYLAAARDLRPARRQEPPRQPRRDDARQREMFSDEAIERGPTNDESREQLKILHWRIDAEVLSLYNLPAPLERKVLDLFSGVRRRGVPFEQTEYLPKGFTDLDRLSDLLAITADWPKTNRRRAKLIDLEEEGRLTDEQAKELERLQWLADANVSLFPPVQMPDADRVIDDLKRRGLWKKPS